jgi:hypothetical protein
MRHRRTRRVLGLSAAVLVLGGYASGSAAEGPYPGLPQPPGQGGWTGAPQTGTTQTLRARQWVQVPMQSVAVFAVVTNRNHPPSDPRSSTSVVTNSVYFVAPAGSEHNYGMSPLSTVRTVAFGAIPVEATVQLLQRRKDGFPAPIVFESLMDKYRTFPPGHVTDTQALDTVIEDRLTVRVTRLAVDGVDLALSQQCQTAEPGKLSLVGKGYWFDDPTVDQQHPWNTGHFGASAGGFLKGTVDIPPFAGCLTASGEDVSRVLTSAVSGPDNPVQLNVGSINCQVRLPPPSTNNGPPRPGQTSPEAICAPEAIPPLIPIP